MRGARLAGIVGSWEFIERGPLAPGGCWRSISASAAPPPRARRFVGVSSLLLTRRQVFRRIRSERISASAPTPSRLPCRDEIQSSARAGVELVEVQM